MTRDGIAGEELFCDYGYIDQYIQVENTVRNLYEIGRWWTNKSEVEYHKYLKQHIKVIRNTVNTVKPYLDLLKDWIR